ncbi:hypothetical protein [Levilactobacillus bambusae]|uniref:LXG domain-containing protein n=1 Tax=Levilactobacillus bambusae TaxID=2024736 RepID=A0A2V1MW47_9LACO|nr:hypothetical protein [Levilactobacillus bambusae]PWF99353.1 hypothetical protein DCM90_07815 [Levilactobacillus bambusae]
MTQTNGAQYLNVLSQVLKSTEDTATKMNGDFQKLRNALDTGTEHDISTSEYEAIKTTFQDGTDVYEGDLNRLAGAQAPVRVLGKHKQLVAAYRDYTEACQAMVNSLNPTEQTVDKAAFDAAEQAQDAAMQRVNANTQRIMMTAM